MSTSNLPPGVTRGPDGQFRASGETFDDVEVATFGVNVGVEASNLGGGTGFEGGSINPFEGVQVIDYDEVVDRNERLHLIHAEHLLVVWQNSTTTADGTVSAAVELSASPALSAPTLRATSPVAGNVLDGVVTGFADEDDTIDIIGRPLTAVGTAPFSDGATGVGGGGSAGRDEYESSVFPAEMARFHPRDELFLNGRLIQWNVDDAGIHANVAGQHIYGVVQD